MKSSLIIAGLEAPLYSELWLSPKFLLVLCFILILGKIHCNEESRIRSAVLDS